MAGIVVAINKTRMIADFSLLKDTKVPKEQEMDTNLHNIITTVYPFK
mgnify:FL=1